jgi:hypothetical protein
MPTLPPLRSVSTEFVEVAYASVLLPMYRFPPSLEKSQCFRLVPALLSVRPSWPLLNVVPAEEVPTSRSHGVDDVPIAVAPVLDTLNFDTPAT